ncbi:fused MFS/spermidine synthase [Agromyces endophyticus]|uniref:spermidine synthase n=1 Tax=Agromyces sp. H17E-10 TaxID=2932244 RepID=UPI001FD06B22|nr:fused MFS/spermidine synthase [Agromyces sp. H17E-10]UOQ88233.1 fused MFS/spermidine synthase [Agromyces sp. H17E-10]
MPASPRRIEFETDVFSSTGFTLLVDDVAQSHVDRADPTRLFFEYVRRIGHVIDAVGLPGEPLRALHLGGGAMTLPRYVAASRPDSHQVVVELDGELARLVQDRMPLPRGADIEVRVADAAAVVEQLAESRGREPAAARFDLVVVDLYDRLEAPAFVETREFMGGCLGLLADRGLLVVNVADAAGLDRLRAQARAVARADPSAELLVAGDANVVSGAEEGNTVLVAAPRGLPDRLAERLAAHGPHPAAVLEGERLDFVLWGAC